jgi:protein TonB
MSAIMMQTPFRIGQEQPPNRRAAFFLLAVVGHIVIAGLFLIALKGPDPIPDDMAIELVAAPATPVPQAPAPPQVKPPEAKPEIKQTPRPHPVQQRVIPKPAPIYDPPSPAAVAVTPAPPHAEAAPAQPTPQAAPPPTYLATLYAHLARYKHYPRAAQLAHVEGTALLRFTMDRQGKVLSYRIERGSGHADLDAEVSAMIERAQPLPAPPADMPDTMEMVIPVQFSVH